MGSAPSLILTAILAVLYSLSSPLPATDLPPQVSATLSQISPTATVIESTPFQAAGENLYVVEVEIPETRQTREWYLDSHGVPMGVQIFGRELPKALRESLPASLRKKGGCMPDAVKIFERGQTLFEFERREKGVPRALGFGPDGHQIYTQIDSDQLPKALRKTLDHLIQSEGKLESILQRHGRRVPSYQLAFEREGKPLWITVAPSGKVLRREETADFETTPPPIQAAILAVSQTADPMRILRQSDGRADRFEVRLFKDCTLQVFLFTQSGKPLGPPMKPQRLP